MSAPSADAMFNEWARIRPRPVIDTHGSLPDLAAQSWKAISVLNDPPYLFRHATLPVRMEDDDDGAPSLRPLTDTRMRHELSRAVDWQRRDPRTGSVTSVAPPMDVARDLLAHRDPPLPRLRRITRAPVFTEDGALILEPGYHAVSGIYYAPVAGVVIPEVSTAPSPAELRRAVDMLRDDLLGDFPFVADAERAHAIALLLAPILRELIIGPVPLTLIEKPAPGTGASLLVDALMRPVLGNSIPVMTESRDEDDWRKKITAKLMTAPPVVLIDNLRNRLDSAALAAAVTSTVHEDRILGRSEMTRLPIRCVWAATGNNPALSNEMARRCVRVRLDAKTDRPWERGGFRHPNLLGWMTAHRGQLIWAALTIGQAWIAAGRPRGRDSLGMFEGWAATLGGVLDVAGVPGFLANTTELYDTADAEGAAWRAFVTAWWGKYAGRDVGVSDLWHLIADDGVEPIALPLGNGGERSQKTRLGQLVARQRDRQFGDLRVVPGGQRMGAQLWRLVRR